jgi:hypothetical protein
VKNSWLVWHWNGKSELVIRNRQGNSRNGVAAGRTD